METKYDGKDITIDDITTEEKLSLLKNYKACYDGKLGLHEYSRITGIPYVQMMNILSSLNLPPT